jgi:transcriptional regulator with XRE-family HTH domain
MDRERGRRGAIYRPRYQFLLKRLREARRVAGLTQEAAGNRLGKGKQYVSKCELGERRIDPIDLQDFAILYGKPVGFFLPRRGQS